tara:strand:+ start:866 stop:1132 length:267 start_codon:yes stop_codon:yes gene_type:complete
MSIKNKAKEDLEIIDITLLLRQRRCRDSIDEELQKMQMYDSYYGDADIILEGKIYRLQPFVIHRRTGKRIDVLYNEDTHKVEAHIIPQ